MASSVRLAGVVLAAILAGIVWAVAGRADGDPASDYLYTQRVFFPYTVGTSKGAQDALTTTIQRAERAGYPIRVALIGGPGDLGVVTALWNKPKQYARFLDLELTFAYKGPLLIVMPSGIGYAHYKHSTAKEERRLASVRVATGSDALARTAITAIGALAAQSGHRIALPRVPTTSSSSGLRNRVLAGGIVVAFVAVVLGIALLLRRRVVRA